MLNTNSLSSPITLTTARLRLVPMSVTYLDQVMEGLDNEDFRRLTGTHDNFTREDVERFLTAAVRSDERADWAILRSLDGIYLGEVVLNELDRHNRSMNFRIAINDPAMVGRRYGTEATRAVVEYGFEHVGLHRISLGVYAFNPRARRVYEHCGFKDEGLERDALFWRGEWIDQHRMALLETDPWRSPEPAKLASFP